jgi:hypothetical protein
MKSVSTVGWVGRDGVGEAGADSPQAAQRWAKATSTDTPAMKVARLRLRVIIAASLGVVVPLSLSR